MPHDLASAAVDYARGGYAVFPCCEHGERPKAPYLNGGFKAASTEITTVEAWWRQWPKALIGWAIPADILVVDIDRHPGGRDGQASWDSFVGDREVPVTATASTPSSGSHLYFRLPPGAQLKQRTGWLPGVDVRVGGRGYVILPPSRLAGAGGWTWQHSIEAVDVAVLPGWLLDGLLETKSEPKQSIPAPEFRLLTAHSTDQYANAALRREVASLSAAPPGERNSSLNRTAFRLGRFVRVGSLRRDDVEAALLQACLHNGLTQTDGEPSVRATILSGLGDGVALNTQPSTSRTRTNRLPQPDGANELDLTEDGLAVAFIDQHSSKLRFDHSRGRWFFWSGSHWQVDETQLVLDMVRGFTRSVRADAPDRLKALARTRTNSEIERAARTDRRVAIGADAWNASPWLLATPGGTIDLRTGVLREADPADMINACCSVTPAPRGTPRPMWDAFLDQATGTDDELKRFIQQVAGYSLTGTVQEEAFFFVYGPGGNGKGTLIGAIAAIMGTYARAASMQTFTAGSQDRHLTELARLAGARLVTASETEEGRTWALARIKEISGNERPITANYMRQDHFEFRPTFKLVLIGNSKPKIPTVDDATVRRLNVIPFTRKPSSPDLGLKARLMSEYPAILRWMIEGALDWAANGLLRPQSVVSETEQYLQDENLLGQWLEERTELASTVTTAVGDLFQDWEHYAQSSGEVPGSKKTFSGKLEKVGFRKGRGVRGERAFVGLRLRRPPNHET